MDSDALFYKERHYADDEPMDEGHLMVTEYKETLEQYRKFFREFFVENFGYRYREQLKLNYSAKNYYVEVDYGDLKLFNEEAAAKLSRYPNKFIPALESAAKEVVDAITHPRPEGQEVVEDIQVMITFPQNAQSVRRIKSSNVSETIKVSGIVIAASQVRSRATIVSLQCRTCRHIINDIKVDPGLEGFPLPRKCQGSQAGAMQRCPLDPYYMLPDKCVCVDFQTLKLQECPDDVPHGEMPRHMQVYVDRYLVDRVTPGNRVNITGVLSIKKMFDRTNGKATDKTTSRVRIPYIRALGIEVQNSGPGRYDKVQFTPEEERKFKEFAKSKEVYQKISKSIAPSIFGSNDIKNAIACLLFGGSRKRLPDGLTRRGDINVLLLGDPGTAKSQLLKFVEKVAPVAVYTSGKGSSAAGLTASVMRDPHSRSFILEGGAMVLADGGVVCIDEFDKMREDDRVAIHEAMEQQTISIAKAGITTTLNSRCSVLAAANSVFGRWDDEKGDANIDFMPTILSRFDTIFVVKDLNDSLRDTELAKHVISVHMKAEHEGPEKEDELSLEFLKRYVMYARDHCAPRLNAKAAEKLSSHYVKIRNPTDQTENRRHQSLISITVRQLEAVVRMSEALAKMELLNFVEPRHVDEALRLFQVSTVAAAAAGSLAGIEGFTSERDQRTFDRIEKLLKKSFVIGTHVSQNSIIENFVNVQKYPMSMVKRVIDSFVKRGDFQYRMQRKLLYRIK
ncbi:DNA replication licensing factor MCM5 [Aphelenchoides besseyi]|nr:DNA replication licensing factor MCM5 [Aphelenchoides besseyi]KAI6207954.1 DNA replication licensing factor MCM5 [Aphelenchoides besseyi]